MRPFHLIRELTTQFSYRITLLSLLDGVIDPRLDAEVRGYCADLRTVPDHFGDSTRNWALQHLKNVLSYENLTRDRVFLTPNYIPEFARELRRTLSRGEFDAIYATGPMAPLLYGAELPKIVEPLDAYSVDCLAALRDERNLAKKVLWLLQLLQTAGRESLIFPDFDFCVAVTGNDARKLARGSPSGNVEVIPNGVDSAYFSPEDGQTEDPSLVFVGGLGMQKNVRGILHFYSECYPRIVEQCPGVKLYLVGRRPASALLRLTADDSVVITGEVPDVRPYLRRATVSVNPIWDGTGIKNKVLEAMSMEKPVVTTTAGAMGIEATPGIHLLVEDDPHMFADAVVGLIQDPELRRSLAASGGFLVREKHSWEQVANALHSLYAGIIES